MSLKEKLIIGAALILAFGAFVIASINTGTDTTDLSVSGNEAIDELTPRRNAEALAQQDVIFDLAPGFSGRIVSINDSPIPAEQLITNSAQGLITFRPGDDAVLERLEGPEVCVLAEYWPVSKPDETRPFSWCFEVV